RVPRSHRRIAAELLDRPPHHAEVMQLVLADCRKRAPRNAACAWAGRCKPRDQLIVQAHGSTLEGEAFGERVEQRGWTLFSEVVREGRVGADGRCAVWDGPRAEVGALLRVAHAASFLPF